jgi:hypothetical protein
MKKFFDCQIIVKSQAEKREFLRACKHIHDFSVMFDKNRKITEVLDEWGRETLTINTKGGIRERKEIKPIRRKIPRGSCGICLNDEDYPFINFLAHLYDCDDLKDRDRFIKVRKS